MAEVIMPQMSKTDTEGVVLKWLKKDGEMVKVGDVIAEIETDKSMVEVEAEGDGVLHIQVLPGKTVPVSTVIAIIGNGAAALAN